LIIFIQHHNGSFGNAEIGGVDIVALGIDGVDNDGRILRVTIQQHSPVRQLQKPTTVTFNTIQYNVLYCIVYAAPYIKTVRRYTVLYCQSIRYISQH